MNSVIDIWIKRQKDKRQIPKREFNVVSSGQFRTLAMFYLKALLTSWSFRPSSSWSVSSSRHFPEMKYDSTFLLGKNNDKRIDELDLNW